MPLFYATPVIIESLFTLTTESLRGIGLFKNDHYASADIVITKGNGEKCKLTVTINTQVENCYMELEYLVEDELIKYTIPLVRLPNYLTGMHTLYFVCPEVNKLCRKLHLHDKHFKHRLAIPKGYYFQSTLSRKRAASYKSVKHLYKLESIVAQRSMKHYKTHRYKVLTQRHRKVVAAAKQLQTIKSFD